MMWLDVAVGMAFIYLLFSMICSSILEAGAWAGELRAKTLKRELTRLFGDENAKRLLEDVLRHPLLSELYKPFRIGRSAGPSYIPTQIFSVTMIDLLIGSANRQALPAIRAAFAPRAGVVPTALDAALYAALTASDAAKQPDVTNELIAAIATTEAARQLSRDHVAKLPEGPLRSVILEMLDDDTTEARRRELVARLMRYVLRLPAPRVLLDFASARPSAVVGNALAAVVEATNPDARAHAAEQIAAILKAAGAEGPAMLEAARRLPEGAAKQSILRALTADDDPTHKAAALDLQRMAVNDPVAELRHVVELIGPSSSLGRTLRAILDDSVHTFTDAKLRIEQWFDDSMEHCSASYRRRSQMWLLAISFLVVVCCDIDSFRIGRVLTTDPEMRASIAQTAARWERQHPGGVAQPQGIAEVTAQIADANRSLHGVPVGWTTDTTPRGWEWLQKLVGLLLSMVALSLGAPFWFALVNQLISLRAVGPPPSPSSTAQTIGPRP